jgi:hypothetical protein
VKRKILVFPLVQATCIKIHVQLRPKYAIKKRPHQLHVTAKCKGA